MHGIVSIGASGSNVRRTARQLHEDAVPIRMSPGGFPGSTPGGDGGSEGMRTQTGGAMGRYDIAEPCSVDPLTDLVTFRAMIIE